MSPNVDAFIVDHENAKKKLFFKCKNLVAV